MREDLWSERDTKPDAIESALREMLRERHAANQSLAPARVLNLIVVVERSWKGEISNRLDRVGRFEASRTILCAVEDGRETLDAVAVMSYQEPSPGSIGVMHEKVEIDMGPSHLSHLDTIVDPVVVSELPTMLWTPHGHEEAGQALKGMVDVALLDSDDLADATEGLARAADTLESSYVVDLAWLRTTPWRERLAAAFDPIQRRPLLGELDAIAIRHGPSSAASALLLAGWLASRLRWEARALTSANGAGMQGSAWGNDCDVRIRLEPVELNVPGLSGVTVASGDRFSLSLDRAQGGLCEKQAMDGRERVWQILGASRGEPGILGEGVRQAMLRDPTYGPALSDARRFCG